MTAGAPLERTLLTHDQVAVLLRGGSAKAARDWFWRHRAGLEALGFPPPVPGIARRWDPVAIHAWLDSQVPAHLRPYLPGPAAAAGGDDWETKLDAAARDLAAAE